jgi:hypothetical protein
MLFLAASQTHQNDKIAATNSVFVKVIFCSHCGRAVSNGIMGCPAKIRYGKSVFSNLKSKPLSPNFVYLKK